MGWIEPSELILIGTEVDRRLTADTTVSLGKEIGWEENPINSPEKNRGNERGDVLDYAAANSDNSIRFGNAAFQQIVDDWMQCVKTFRLFDRFDYPMTNLMGNFSYVGVEIKNESVAPLLAPLFLILVASGMTPPHMNKQAMGYQRE